MTRSVLAVWAALLLQAAGLQAAEAAPDVRHGTATFLPAEDEAKLVPEQFRMEEHTFSFEERMLPDVSDNFAKSLVTFPSPVVTAYEQNNTVHCEYFRPKTEGKHPACVVLHILGGDFELSRLFCNALAQQGVAALFVKMPYYGPRRPAEGHVRMIARDPEATVANIRQAVLDIRQAAAWLSSQDEVDAKQLGIFGISLGGITGGLAAAAEPRFQKICLVLAGGDIGQIADLAWDSPRLADIRELWNGSGRTKEDLHKLLSTVDPVTYAASLKGRDVLMLNAKRDEVIPRSCTESLWTALGKPPIVWYDAGHYTAAFFLFDALARVPEFFQPASAVTHAELPGKAQG